MKNLLARYALLQGRRVMSILMNVLFFLICSVNYAMAQSNYIQEWNKDYPPGGFVTWLETSDGYLVGGYNSSAASDMKTSNSRGGDDFWIIKLNKSGDKVWDNTYGGPSTDQLKKIVKASDGFYLLGTSNSEIGSEKSEISRGGNDFWIVKITPTGQKLWDRTIGGSSIDNLEDAIVLPDNSLLIGGSSTSQISGDKTAPLKSGPDYWVVKLSASGTKLWDKTFSGTAFNGIGGTDVLTTVVATADGGFLLGGSSDSFNGLDKTSGINPGPTVQQNYWVVKISSSGNKVWDKSYQSTYQQTIINTPDNGFIIAGKYSVFLSHEEWYDNYNNFVKISKIDPSGNLLWDKSYGPIDGVEIGPVVSSITPMPDGFAVLHVAPQYGLHSVVMTFNFEGVLQSRFTSGTLAGFIKSTAAGDIFITGHNFITKYVKVINSQVVDLELRGDSDGVYFSLNPKYYNPDVTKVKYFVDGIEKGESTSYPYNYFLRNLAVGNHVIQAKAITNAGAVFSSAAINWRTFEFLGSQAESSFSTATDVGNYPITSEKAVTLNGGSSIRLWDIGDKVKCTFSTENTSFRIKVRLRSGLYSLTSTYSNPTAYFNDGYTFTVNGTVVKFTGDLGSVSGKDPSYGGSYWGTMVSDPISLKSYGNILEVQANKQWLGVDYWEILPVQSDYFVEAETAYQVRVDPGTRQIGTESYPTLSGGSSAKIWDVGDQIFFGFYTTGGYYEIQARVRAGVYSGTYNSPTRYWPNGYSFSVDDTTTSFTGDLSTLSGKDASYGGSYWGTMKSSHVYLSKGRHYLSITAKQEWAGVDYIIVKPINTASTSVARVADEEKENLMAPFPNPVDHSLTVGFSKAIEGNVKFTLADAFGKVHYSEIRSLKNEDRAELILANVRTGVYMLKVESGEGEKTYRIVKN
jgi:hypothetical protein